MEQKKTNRSVLRTQSNLKKGLYELLMQKPANEITVRELSERAKINRGTFYLHYRDIFDMISQVEEELFRSMYAFWDSMEESQSISGDCFILSAFFRFIWEHDAAFQALMGPNGDAAFLNRIQDLFRERLWNYMQKSYVLKREEFDIFYDFSSGGFISLLRTWLHAPEASMERMTEMASRMAQGAASVFTKKEWEAV